MLEITHRVERWPITGNFTIARGAKTEAVVIVLEVRDGTHLGRGECVPYARYGESIESVSAQITSVMPLISKAPDRLTLLQALPGGAARNALDCALWDLETKKYGNRAWQIANIPAPLPVTTCFTISLGAPETMYENAKSSAHRSLLKIKLGSTEDIARLTAVRRGAPNSRLVVDANEGWTVDTITEMLRACADCGVELVEQPLPEKFDAALQTIPHLVPLCADESFHTAADITRIATCYDAVNIKLDKTGGLTEALSCVEHTRRAQLDIMVGCMVGTSLSMAPAMVLTPFAKYVDLDGPLLLARDRDEGLKFDDSLVHPPTSTLWG